MADNSSADQRNDVQQIERQIRQTQEAMINNGEYPAEADVILGGLNQAARNRETARRTSNIWHR